MANDSLYVPVRRLFALDDLDLSSDLIREVFNKLSLCVESVSDRRNYVPSVVLGFVVGG